jgi:hypothetical protein
MIYQEEQCPDTGRIHLQGYVEFDRPMRFGAVRRLPHLESGECWWGARKGSREEARDYCDKEESRVEDNPIRFEFGDFRRTSGKLADRSKLILDQIKEGKTLKDIAEEDADMALRYHGGIDKLVAAHAKCPERPNMRVVLHFGPGGNSFFFFFFNILTFICRNG